MSDRIDFGWFKDFPGRVVRVTVLDVDGSAPREAGATLIVSEIEMRGTIGGGRLEFEAINEARRMLAEDSEQRWLRRMLQYPLGPALEQCCGGMVTLFYERFGDDDMAEIAARVLEAAVFDGRRRYRGVLVRSTKSGIAPVIVHGRRSSVDLPAHVLAQARNMERGTARRDFSAIVAADREMFAAEPIETARPVVCVYGAGHVGRAVVDALALTGFAIRWYDVDEARFPAPGKRGIRRVASDDLAAAAEATPPRAYHLIMTFSHALDEALAQVLIARTDTAYVGLIGSETKAARFRQRFQRAGLGAEEIGRLVCPLGIAGLEGKAPHVIAASVVADLLMRRQAQVAVRPAGRQKRSRPGT